MLLCVLVSCVCFVCSMINLVFLQVLEPFCPLPEQEFLEPEELGVDQPTSSTTMFLTSEKELNSTLPLSFNASHIETEAVSGHLTGVTSPFFPDAEPGLSPPLSHCPSLSQTCSVSVPVLSNIPSRPHTDALPAENDACIPAQTQSEPPISHPHKDVIPTPVSEESACTQTENLPLQITVAHGTSEKQGCTLQVSKNPTDSLV